jgi:putative ABC transport system permease protein
MSNLFQDLRYAVRMIRARPGFTLVVALIMALGIGAVTSVFSVVNAFLLRPLPYKDADRLLRVQSTFNSEVESVSFLDYRDWRERNRSFEDMAFFNDSWLANVDFGGETEALTGVLSTWNLFSVLKVEPALGRSFLPEDDLADHEKVALISHGLWKQRFGADPNTPGQVMQIDAVPYTIIGVMPAGFKYPSQVDLWIPAARWFDHQNRRSRIDKTIARLAPGVTVEQARADMQTVAQSLEQQYPDTNKGVGVALVRERELWVGNVRPSLMMLMGACAFVLLIACANVANLLLARAGARQKEMAIRSALGARRLRLVRQLLIESGLLALAGGALGLLLALWGVEALTGLVPVELPFWIDFHIDGLVLCFTIAVSVLTGVLFGIVPALQATRLNLSQSLKDSSRGTAGAGRRRARGLLVASEIAFALLLLIGAGLMMRSFLNLQKTDPGFNPENVLMVETNFSIREDLRREQSAVVFDQVIKRIAALPGVEAVGATSDLPFVGQETWDRYDFTVEGQTLDEYKANPLANFQSVNTDYFRAMGMPLVGGRLFTEQDATSNASPTIISRQMAERYWPGQDPIGKRLKAGEPGSQEEWDTVIGVVGDVRHNGLLSEAGFDTYGLYRVPWKEMHIVVRTRSSAAAIAPAVRKEIWATSSDLGISRMMPLERLVGNSIWQPRLWGMLLGVFSVVALMLAGAGVYGVVSYTVAERTHEIGIRMAVGAQARDVLRLIVGQAALLALAGIGAGLAGALLLTRLLANLLHGVSPTDPLIFLILPLLLAGVALGASFIPAYRATKVDLMIALKYE